MRSRRRAQRGSNEGRCRSCVEAKRWTRYECNGVRRGVKKRLEVRVPGLAHCDSLDHAHRFPTARGGIGRRCRREVDEQDERRLPERASFDEWRLWRRGLVASCTIDGPAEASRDGAMFGAAGPCTCMSRRRTCICIIRQIHGHLH